MRVDDASQGGDTALHLATVRGFREVAQVWVYISICVHVCVMYVCVAYVYAYV